MYGPYCWSKSGFKPEEFLQPIFTGDFQKFWTNLEQTMATRDNRKPQEDATSTYWQESDQFVAKLNVQNYTPEEISVKVSGKHILIVEGKQEEKEIEGGSVSRQFNRKFIIPDGYDINKIETKLDNDGILTITVPKLIVEGETCRVIPVQRLN